MTKVEWRGRPIYICIAPTRCSRRRAEDAVAVARSDVEGLDAAQYARTNTAASSRPSISCSKASARTSVARRCRASRSRRRIWAPQWPGGFYCPCHGSKFDLAGRVFQGVPAPTNLPRAAVPLHQRQYDPDRLGHGEGITMASTEADHFDRLGPRLERARRVDRRALSDDEAHQGARHRVLRVEELQHSGTASA